jgi:hypothetical protein
MRFASLGGSNTSDYAAAGKSVADSAAKTFAIQRKSGPDYGGLSQVAMKTKAEEKIASINASAKVTKAGISAYSDVTKTGQKVAVFNKKNEIDLKQRKAGGLAAIGKIAGAGFLAAADNTKGRERPKADRQSVLDKFNADNKTSNEKYDAATTALSDFKPSSTSGSTSGKVDGGSESPTTGTSSNLGGQPFDLSKLTDDDYNELGYVISSEAALNTNDEFGVAANVLTRLQSGKYGNSIGEIIRAKGQYEGVYTGNSRYSPEIVARLKSSEGQKKIQDYFQQLNGRTEFKGQTQLGNRVASEDPMFDPKGNFYHYAGQ